MARYLAYLFLLISFSYAAWKHTLNHLCHALWHTIPSIVSLLINLSSILLLGSVFFALLALSPLHEKITSLLSKPLRHLYKMLPPDHPALSYLALNMSANMIGVSNAATPAGIQAMHALQSTNPTPKRATDAMCLLLAVNTSSIQLLPLTTIAILTAAGNHSPWHWWPSMMIATSATTLFAITAAYTLAYLSRRLTR